MIVLRSGPVSTQALACLLICAQDMSDTQRFVNLGRPQRLWTVAAVHGEVERLRHAHALISRDFAFGDRLVYLGNLIGRGDQVRACVDEALRFRRAILALPGMIPHDVVFLRGCQEEMWQKLLQIQFAPNPRDVLAWMLDNGVEATVRAYDGDLEAGQVAARDGARSLTRWTNRLRDAIRRLPGHDPFFANLRRAAFTEGSREAGATGIVDPEVEKTADAVLLVSGGVDVSRPFAGQGDTFWWGGTPFERIEAPYGPFVRVVRGFDLRRGGVRIQPHALTLDAGCGFGGALCLACLSGTGDVLERWEI